MLYDALPFIPKAELIETLTAHGFYTPEIERAMKIAEAAHADQKRDNNTPYLEEHVFYVTTLLLSWMHQSENLETLLICGLLHDVVEDSDLYSIQDIEKLFNYEIAEIVSLLSKEKSKKNLSQSEKYERNKFYLRKLSSNPNAAIIKIIDRIANLHCIIAKTIRNRPDKSLRFIEETKDLFIPISNLYNLVELTKRLYGEISRVEALFNEIK